MVSTRNKSYKGVIADESVDANSDDSSDESSDDELKECNILKQSAKQDIKKINKSGKISKLIKSIKIPLINEKKLLKDIPKLKSDKAKRKKYVIKSSNQTNNNSNKLSIKFNKVSVRRSARIKNIKKRKLHDNNINDYISNKKRKLSDMNSSQEDKNKVNENSESEFKESNINNSSDGNSSDGNSSESNSSECNPSEYSDEVESVNESDDNKTEATPESDNNESESVHESDDNESEAINEYDIFHLNTENSSEENDSENNSSEDIDSGFLFGSNAKATKGLTDTVEKRRAIFKKCLKSAKTKKIINLTASQENQLFDIYEIINKVPKISDIVQTNMPIKSKCNLMEKLNILGNLEHNTVEYVCLKNNINSEIEKYKNNNNKNINYKKYEVMEKQLDVNHGAEIPIKYRILDADISTANKIAIFTKYKSYSAMVDCNSENSKLLGWLELALALPTVVKQLPVSLSDGNPKINEFLYNTKIELDKYIYGLDNVKHQILVILNNILSNPHSKGNSMALVGPQGVGKTEIARILSKIIKLPFINMPLGGAKDSSFLHGHSYTYEGSQPGAIVQSLITMKYLNGIIFFDEIDKISETKEGDDISKSLLHISDTTQNHEFKDKYLGNDISIDLSNIWFIYSLNYIECLDKTLQDRISIILVDGYTKKEKKEIAKSYLLPNLLNKLGLDKKDISFDDDALMHLIEITDKLYSTITKSDSGKSGVRQLKHVINNIVMKLNMIKNCILDNGSFGDLKLPYSISDFKLPFVITKSHLELLDVLPKTVESPTLSMYC